MSATVSVPLELIQAVCEGHQAKPSGKRCADCNRRWPCTHGALLEAVYSSPEVSPTLFGAEPKEGEGTGHAAAFEKGWEAFPRRNGKRGSKKVARQRWDRLVKPALVPDVLRAIENYAAWCAATETYPADMSTWLNQERWDEFLEDADVGDLTPSGYRRQADVNADRGQVVL